MEVKGVVVVEDVRPWPEFERRGYSGALEQVANRPIAHHVLDVLAAAGIEDVVVVSSSASAAGVRASLARRDRPGARVRIRYVERCGPVGLDDSLGLAAPLIDGSPCVVHIASGLLEQPLEPLIARLRSDRPDLVAMVHHGKDPQWRLSPPTQQMLRVAELRPDRATLSMAGVCAFGPEALDLVSRTRWTSHGGNGIDLTAVAARISSEGGNFQVLPVGGWRRYAGDPLDLLELNRIALDRMQCELPRPSGDGNLIEGRVWIHERASVRTSVIVGPTVVGPDVHIADAYIGPYTSIGTGARIEGAEIERSIIAAGASIMHVSGRLVASVVGRDSRVFRDFSLPRAFRLRVGDGTEIALC